jgi:hypothetical protein
MSTDMSGPLDGMPAGTNLTDKVAPAGELPNKTPSFVSAVSDTREFLPFLRTRFPSSLSAQLKVKKLMTVPGRADDFRSTVSALRSLDGSKGVIFHTFCLPEDRMARLLIKNIGRKMPESVVREEMEALGICVQGVMQLRFGRLQISTPDRALYCVGGTRTGSSEGALLF